MGWDWKYKHAIYYLLKGQNDDEERKNMNEESLVILMFPA